jgi:peptidoglycan/LPS O-acetylase OafA/YrhL
MFSIGNPVYPVLGIALMALACWGLSMRIPFLDAVEHAHAGSLSLDGLRGLLASSVFFHHAYITYVFMQTGQWVLPTSNFYAQLGPTAVTLFFFISGYLFWGKALRNPASLRPARLWTNRLQRIGPGYWAAAALAFLTVAVVTHFQMRESARDAASVSMQWLAFGFPCQPDINGVSEERLTGAVFWTLRVELLYYLVLPALLWFRKGRRLVLFLLLAAGLYKASHLLHANVGPLVCLADLAERFTRAMVSGFPVGMIAAYANWRTLREGRVERWLSSSPAAVVGVGLLAGQLFLVPAKYAWYESILPAAIFFMVVAGNSFFGALTSKPLRCLGQVSYSVYIFHGLILFICTSLWNQQHPIAAMSPMQYWGLILVIGIVVAVVCTGTYCWIERPFFVKRQLMVEKVVAA